MGDHVSLFDTTLRDGAQTQGIDFSLKDKIDIARALDRLGIDYVEGGWPGANETDTAFFAKPPALSHARLGAFGMTRRHGRSAANDPGLVNVVRSGADAIILVGKSALRHVREAIEVDPDENLAMISDSMREACQYSDHVMYDAEHFFDGYREDPSYALACLQSALDAGARWVVLCDTNGGMMSAELGRIVENVCSKLPNDHVGIHTHNDTGHAIANSLAAIEAGARQIQGTLNGLGERCGNADLISIIPNLVLKTSYKTSVKEESLGQLRDISRDLWTRLNRTPHAHAPYVGDNAFAHKGGLHASAVLKDPALYEHIKPETVGNKRIVVVSDQAGQANIRHRLQGYKGLDLSKPQISALLDDVKSAEARGLTFDGADASFELLARRHAGQIDTLFRMQRFRVIDERWYNEHGDVQTVSEATIKLNFLDGQQDVLRSAEGNGPVNALDSALRSVLTVKYPTVSDIRLIDYRVRIVTPSGGTDAITRVTIDSEDTDGRQWTTVGASGNVIDASYTALRDSIYYHICVNQVWHAS